MTTNRCPLVSIVTPTFNRGGYIGEAIASAIGQTFTDWQMIVVDDGSTDDTDRVLSKITDSRVTIIKHSVNAGVAAARNTGIRAASGKYLATLDSDDIWMPAHLAALVAKMEADPDLQVIGASAFITGPQLGETQPYLWRANCEPDAIAVKLLLDGGAFIHSSTLIRCAAIEAVGGYDEADRVFEDLSLWLRMFRAGFKMVALPAVGVIIRESAASITRGPDAAIRNGKDVAMIATALAAATGEPLSACTRTIRIVHKQSPPGSLADCERVLAKLDQLYPHQPFVARTRSKLRRHRWTLRHVRHAIKCRLQRKNAI